MVGRLVGPTSWSSADRDSKMLERRARHPTQTCRGAQANKPTQFCNLLTGQPIKLTDCRARCCHAQGTQGPACAINSARAVLFC